ncbi:tetratricopeptide repeat protein [Paenibacillus camelliae]|uniref:tetratricopeptide repeat protein n=1 Tax=Paenibacillus camelliae TaxID=512410 RepID=UPI00203BD390|nr:tetratricopeptide repeat protein [Paenibacillus camelliae]MCM3635774.1 tetratricopeptide repeat protein [Paenibacillus camelliae]
MKKNKKVSGEQHGITLLQLDANLFYERAIRSLDRFHYDKALKYFQKAVDYEPNNPINYCNMAGVLSEIGKYGESNHILQKVINEIDPDMTECHFYMANNFANMEYFEEAERELLHYLQEDEEGHFLEEAEEMIELLQYELERPTPLTKVKARAGVYEHIRAREMLEEGKFLEAIRLLETITEETPDFLAAHNNLALAYYYVGMTNDAKQAIEAVLKQDPANLHALCNLAIFYHYEGSQDKLKPLVAMLTKLDPFYQEHLFKLATTMGIVKEHAAALRHFQRLTKQGEAKKDPCISHFAAVAACNIGKLELAEKFWLMTRSMDEQSQLPQFFLILLKQMKPGLPLQPSLSYSYFSTVEEQVEAWEQQARERGEQLESIFKRAYLFWAFQYSDREAKLKAINDLDVCYDAAVEDMLKQYLLKQDEDDYVKRLVMYALRSMGMEDAFDVMLGGKLMQVDAQRVPTLESSSNLADCDPLWERVAELSLAHTARRYNAIWQHDMITLWINYLSKGYVSTSKLTKLEAWAAALEYLTAKLYNKPITYHEAAVRYGTSITTISKRVKEIDAVLGIKSKLKAPWYKR